MKLGKEFSLIETRIVQKSFNGTISNELQEQINKTEKNIEIIEKYIQLKNGEQLKNTINTLTYLNTKVGRLIECGPGRVLCGLAKKTVPSLSTNSVSNVESMKEVLV